MKNVSNAAKVGVLVILLFAGSYAVWRGLVSNPAGSDNYDLWAKFRDASGMPVGSRVVIAGLPVGEIEGLSVDGRYARVTFRVRDDVRIYENAIIYKKSTSLLGDYYLEIDPGSPEGLDPQGNPVVYDVLGPDSQIQRVVEATSPDQLMRRIEESLPNVDAVLLSVRDLSEDMRRIVNGPIQSIAERIDDLVQKEADTVSAILARADESIARIELITRDIRAVTSTADDKVNRILDNIDEASKEARELVVSARREVEDTGTKVREKLDMVDELLASSTSVAEKIDEDQGTLGRLVNDPTIADNVEEITEDAKGFLGTLFGMQTYVGLRSEYNVFSRLARHYVTLELHTRPDKFYYIELEKGPRGDYPVVTLEYDPTVNPDAYVRKVVIEDEIRFTFQFAKRFGFATLRYGLKESTGGIGLDLEGGLFDTRLKLSVDVFDATFDQLPRLKVTGAWQILRHIYILGGIDEALNDPETLPVALGNFDEVPIQFEEFRYGRDFFLGGMIRFNDQDLTSLLTVGGSAVGAAAGD